MPAVYFVQASLIAGFHALADALQSDVRRTAGSDFDVADRRSAPWNKPLNLLNLQCSGSPDIFILPTNTESRHPVTKVYQNCEESLTKP